MHTHKEQTDGFSLSLLLFVCMTGKNKQNCQIKSFGHLRLHCHGVCYELLLSDKISSLQGVFFHNKKVL